MQDGDGVKIARGDKSALILYHDNSQAIFQSRHCTHLRCSAGDGVLFCLVKYPGDVRGGKIAMVMFFMKTL